VAFVTQYCKGGLSVQVRSSHFSVRPAAVALGFDLIKKLNAPSRRRQ
jgi:hypothetical protein